MFENIECKEFEEMKKHTTLRIGGEARWFLLPKNVTELLGVIADCLKYKIKYFILGNGSNLLVSDEGYDGAVISMQKFNHIELLEDNRICVGGGVNLFTLNKFCCDNGFGGLEWSYGIPASVGGACKMNAGAYEGCFCSFIESFEVLKKDKIKTRKKFVYEYRKGCLEDGEILISMILKLYKANKKEIKNRQEMFLSKRKESQPYNFPSLGSVFKRGNNFFPAKLIQDFGLKGTRKGNVYISMKHAGFIINKGEGKASDFLSLVRLIEGVAKKNGYKFEREFVSLGFED